jgi:hypothetical protein
MNARPLPRRLPPPETHPALGHTGGCHDMLVVSQCPDFTPEFPPSLLHPAAARRAEPSGRDRSFRP